MADFVKDEAESIFEKRAELEKIILTEKEDLTRQDDEVANPPGDDGEKDTVENATET